MHGIKTRVDVTMTFCRNNKKNGCKNAVEKKNVL